MKRGDLLHCFWVTGALTLVLGACGTRTDFAATKGLAHGGDGQNYAMLFGAPNGLAGVPTDVRELGTLLQDRQYDFRFRIISNPNATAQQIIDATAEAASTADSLFWYFSGHGNTGILMADDRSFTFHEVADGIREARNNVPLKRLLVFIDSCYAGSFVDGREPIIEESITARRCAVPTSESMDATAESVDVAEQEKVESILDAVEQESDRGIFEEAFVMASSTRNQSSADLGRDRGGAFTWSLRQTIADFRRTREMAKINDVAVETKSRTQNIGGHTPVWRALPSTLIMDEAMFRYED